MTYRVSIFGIDGSGKSSTCSGLVNKLSQQNYVAKTGRPTYHIQNNKKEYLFEKTLKFIDKAHSFSDNLGHKSGVLVSNALNVLLQPNLEY